MKFYFNLLLFCLIAMMFLVANDVNAASRNMDVIITNHQYVIAGIHVGSTREEVEAVFGEPEETRHAGRLWGYKKYGIDFWTADNVVREIHLNKGYKGRINNIKVGDNSSKVFAEYGQPVETIIIEDLHRQNKNKILFRKRDMLNMERIYYQEARLIFWFRDKKIIQIVF